MVRARLTLWVSLVLILLAVLVSGSRSPIVLTGACAGIATLALGKMGRFFSWGIVAYLVFAAGFALLGPGVAERVGSIASTDHIARFNAGDYYDQHDFFEALWMAEPGPVRDLYRAILQVGVAYHHITQGNPRGALKMLRRSAQWFASLPDVCQGVDVRQLREDAAAVEAALRAADGADFDAAEWLPLPPLRTISDTES